MRLRSFLPLVVLAATVLPRTARAQDAAPDLPGDAEVRGPLGPAAVGKIDKYIDYWVAKMQGAKVVKAMADARQGLLNGYNQHGGASYQYAYAGSAAARVVAILADTHRVKQIQAAMALSEMPQITIQPALEKMAEHKNAAVRYWAARGYRRAARLLMIQGGNYAKRTLAALEKLGRSEQSGPVLAEALVALTPYTDAMPPHAAKLGESLDRVWLARCRDLWAGKAGIVEAFRKAEELVTPINPADGKRVLQLLADAMEAATAGLLEALTRKRPEPEGMAELIKSMEVKLGRVGSVEKLPLQSILSKKIDVQQATEAAWQWVEHWKPALKKLQVAPRFVPPVTTAPVTRPVTTTTTAPAGG